MGWGKSGFNCWEFRGPALVLFLFYMNVSGMRPRPRLSSQPLTIPAPLFLLRVRWSIFLVPPWVTASCFLAGNKEAELKPSIFSSLLFFHVLSFLFSGTPADIVTLIAACCTSVHLRRRREAWLAILGSSSMFGLCGVWRGSYFGRGPGGRTE